MKYRTIVADPPWPTSSGPSLGPGPHFGEGNPRPERNGHTALPYNTLSLSEIAALPISEIAGEEAHLYLWTTNILVPKAYEIVRGWGFKPSVILTWCKAPMGIGLGDAFAITTEHVIFGHRGGLRPLTRIPSTWWQWPRGKHSKKPDAFLDLVEQVSPGPYLELFARRRRLGWHVWGDEVDSDVELVS